MRDLSFLGRMDGHKPITGTSISCLPLGDCEQTVAFISCLPFGRSRISLLRSRSGAEKTKKKKEEGRTRRKRTEQLRRRLIANTFLAIYVGISQPFLFKLQFSLLDILAITNHTQAYADARFALIG